MRIGELAARAGVSTRALRYYEEQDLLTSTRTSGGQRLYGDSDVDRVRLIQQLYAAGLRSGTVRDVLRLYMGKDEGGADPAALLSAERARIDRQIADLLAVRARLDQIMAGDPTCRYAPPRTD
ncbi:MerR family transcriptional regulator [Streptomyces sp. NPDC002588]|uniref:MerR family transcriptional regulator n=1 Tax=Streptomyces sp. NPDC002588 TaxID=3154419 RepID=UPI0033243D5B